MGIIHLQYFEILYSGKPKVSEDAFTDLLGNHTFTSKKDEPKTMKDMKKADLAKVYTPEELKVSALRKVAKSR